MYYTIFSGFLNKFGYKHFGALVAQIIVIWSKRLSPLRLWVWSSYQTHVMWKELSTLYWKLLVFLWALQVPPTWCWQGGLGLAPDWPFHCSCALWSDMSHKPRKPSTGTAKDAAQLTVALSCKFFVRLHDDKTYNSFVCGNTT
jgi:hypothetical protein